ncbi:MAG: DUF2183 domain-containing protein [Actinomycetaceae bacterium]|nr:DUF2183 domain-containing protein [Actinomycetaceae bacterium]
MELSDIARAIEDATNRRGIVRRRKEGWLPQILPYTGYGSTSSVHILGRAIMADPQNRPPAILSALPSSAHASFLPEEVSHTLTPMLDLAVHQAEYVQRGFRSFFTTQVGYLRVTVTVNGREYQTRTDRAGYIDFVIPNHGLEPGWHTALLTPATGEPVEAPVMIVSPKTTYGLISDVDDTIVITKLPRAMLAAWNTFVSHTSARKTVPGMAAFYREMLAEHPDAPVFYLSTGAWNTVPALQAFIEANGYPNGPMLFTDWGPTPTGFFRNGQAHKKQQLRNLMITFPNIKWILVGDDGQHDPFLYDEVAREHPRHIRGIALRELEPVEQVLSHGTATALDKRRKDFGRDENDMGEFFRISGGDGNALLRAWRAIRSHTSA